MTCMNDNKEKHKIPTSVIIQYGNRRFTKKSEDVALDVGGSEEDCKLLVSLQLNIIIDSDTSAASQHW